MRGVASRRVALRMTKIVSAALLLVLLAAFTLAHGDSAAPAERDSLEFPLQLELDDAAAELGIPAASAAVVDDGQIVWSGVTGVKTLGGEPVVPSTQFVTASSGKSVVAAIVFRLVDEDRLALGDRVSRYLPDLDGARRIRIRELLEHSSGLPDYLNSREVNDLFYDDPQREWNRDEVLDAIHRLRFRPGSRVSYSNTNYIALGGVIEEITGDRFETVFQREVGVPLELTESSWLYDPTLFDTGAHPYYERRGKPPLDGWRKGFVSTDYTGDVWTDGGLATTGADLATFANELVAGDLVSPASRRAMTDFREEGYGRGVFRYRFDGDTIIGHDGLYGGFSAQHWTDPRSGLTVAVLANLETRSYSDDSSWLIWKRLYRMAVSGEGTPRSPW